MTVYRKSTFWLAVVLALLVGYLTGWKLPLLTKVTYPTPFSVAYENQTRRLWQNQATWTRNYLIGSPNPDADVAMLLNGAQDIGNSFKSFFDVTTGNRVTALMKANVSASLDVVNAVATGRDPAKAKDTWHANGQQLVSYLSSLNPNLDGALLGKLWRGYQDSTFNEIQAHFRHNSTGETNSFLVSYNQIILFSDTLANGMERQFPEKF